MISGAIRVNVANCNLLWIPSPSLTTLAELKKALIENSLPAENMLFLNKKKLLKDSDPILG